MMSPKLSLRTRLFAGFGGLVILLVVAQLWWVRSLTRELGAEVDTVALQVGSSVAQFFTFSTQGAGEAGPTRQLDIGDQRSGSVDWRSQADDESAVWIFSPGADSAPRGATEVRIIVPDGADRERLKALGNREDLESLEISADHTQIQLRGDGDTAVLRLERPDLQAEVPIPRTGVRSQIERFQERLWLGSGLILTLGLVGAAVISHRISTPLATLADAAERVGEGELGIQVEAGGGGPEVRRTVGAFNGMSTRLLSLDRRNRELEALRHLEEIGDVARGLAHSLRNPLNALGLSVEQLANADEPRRASLVETAGRQVKRLDAGIRSFLMLASPGEGAGVEAITLQQLVRDVTLEVLQDADGRVGIDLDLPATPLRLLAVAAELRAVVQALIVNAAEASSRGDRVTVRLAPSGDGARLEVEDSGPGLDPDVRRRLFTPHVSTKPSGSGMGLFLAHRIAGFRYGGRLELLDRDGGGTCARLDIGPRRPLDAGETTP